MSNPNYERVSIQATLCAVSDLHIGSGIEGEHSARDRSGKITDQTHADICLDNNNQPYIPASTIRGYMAKILRNISDEADSEYPGVMNALMGTAHARTSARTSDETDTVGMGKLRVYDARYAVHNNTGDEPEPITRIITQTAIEPITGTSKDHQLFSAKVVNAGAQFSLHIELDNVDTVHIQLLIDALGYLDGSETSQLGKNKSLMSGCLKISEIKIKALHTDDFVAWLQTAHSADKKFENCFRNCFKDIDTPAASKAIALSEFKVLALSIYPTSPLLVNDIHLVQDEKQAPNHVFMRKNKKLCIPASTLKGLIRGHCRKILLTLLHNSGDQEQQYLAHKAIADEMLQEIFGGEKAAGLLRVSDALSVDDAIEHVQSFIGVDRFTGGVANGALYSVEAAIADELPCELYIDRRLLEKDWVVGLLLLVLRDAMESDLSIGWGKSRGFGAFELGIVVDKTGNSRVRNWPEVLDGLGSGLGPALSGSLSGPDRAKQAVEALEYHIMELIEQYIKEGEVA